MKKLRDKWFTPDTIPSNISPYTVQVKHLYTGMYSLGNEGFMPKWKGMSFSPDCILSSELQRSVDGINYTTIASTTAVTTAASNSIFPDFIPLSSDYGNYIRGVVTATNSLGSSLPAYTSNTVLLTTHNTALPVITRTSIFDVVIQTRGTWVSQPAIQSYYYQWEMSIDSGANWTKVGTLTTALTASFFSAYTGVPFDVRVTEYPYNTTTLALPT